MLHTLSRSCLVKQIGLSRIIYVQTRQNYRPALQKKWYDWSVDTDFNQRFPFKDKFIIGDQELGSDKIIEILTQFISEERRDVINRVVQNRTFNLVPVIEGVYDMGNLAAVCRSADALGCGQIYCITNKNDYKQSARTSAGAEKWLAVNYYDSPESCLMQAKSKGYRVLATALGPDSVPIDEVDWTIPSVVVLGNERRGLSQACLEMADQRIVIPMTGFVNSFNISVAAALVLYEAQKNRTKMLGRNGDLNEQQQQILQAIMYLNHKLETASYVRNMLMRPPASFQKKKARFWDKFKFQESNEFVQ